MEKYRETTMSDLWKTTFTVCLVYQNLLLIRFIEISSSIN